MFTISKEFAFSASHQLDGLPADHPCSRLHGHNYTIKLTLTGDLDDIGFVHDYRALAPFKEYLDNVLDHRHLNDILEGNPTAERMSAHLCKVAVRCLEIPRTVFRVAIGVSETPKTWAESSVDIDGLYWNQRYRWGRESREAEGAK
ncbi:6-pyruvoyl trahydropterin synthase family protein [Arthrobacter sulfonylureivorans]|uniref:6-pyruvoyl trahydropterin synthase family protein n=1 Tax=Arthrobacter sulfonylureivorans TaxID=2486855 RepID=UPI0039E3E10C